MIAASATYTIRHPLPGDIIPEEVWPKLTDRIDPAWCWLLIDEEGRITTVLLAAPAHGIVILMRLWSSSTASRYGLRRLFREVARECWTQGYRGWMVSLQESRPEETHIARIARRYRAGVLPYTGYVYVGSVEVACA